MSSTSDKQKIGDVYTKFKTRGSVTTNVSEGISDIRLQVQKYYGGIYDDGGKLMTENIAQFLNHAMQCNGFEFEGTKYHYEGWELGHGRALYCLVYRFCDIDDDFPISRVKVYLSQKVCKQFCVLNRSIFTLNFGGPPRK